MGALEIGQGYISPVRPSGAEQPLPGVTRVLIDERVVVGKDRGASVQPALMGRHYVAERRALVQYIVPGQRKAPSFGTIPEEKICDHPCAVLELGNVRWRILSISSNQVASEKVRRGKYHSRRVESIRVLSVPVDRGHIDPATAPM